MDIIGYYIEVKDKIKTSLDTWEEPLDYDGTDDEIAIKMANDLIINFNGNLRGNTPRELVRVIKKTEKTIYAPLLARFET